MYINECVIKRIFICWFLFLNLFFDNDSGELVY